MYVTRRLSMYKKDPALLSLPPPDGQNTGILVIQDVENDSIYFFCDEPYNRYDIATGMPFPQNTILCALGSDWRRFDFMAIPVINKPLSSGLYYIQRHNDRLAFTSEWTKKKQVKVSFCCHKFVDTVGEVEPKLLDPSSIYQQFYISCNFSGFRVESFASDGFVPSWLRRPERILSKLDWVDFGLDDVSGLNHSLRQCLPDFKFPLSCESSDSVVVGEWYCPSLFVREGYLSKLSMFYKMTLRQQWVRIFSCSRDDITGDSVSVDVNVETEVVNVVGMGTHCHNIRVDNNTKWFEGQDMDGETISVGLDTAITEKITQDQESFGWVKGKVKVKRVEKFVGILEWKKFGCYILVERYAWRTLHERLVLTYEFRHTHHIRCKWE